MSGWAALRWGGRMREDAVGSGKTLIGGGSKRDGRFRRRSPGCSSHPRRGLEGGNRSVFHIHSCQLSWANLQQHREQMSLFQWISATEIIILTPTHIVKWHRWNRLPLLCCHFKIGFKEGWGRRMLDFKQMNGPNRIFCWVSWGGSYIFSLYLRETKQQYQSYKSKWPSQRKGNEPLLR